MRASGGNKDRHWHKWNPMDKKTDTDKVCECGAIKTWDSKKWVVKQGKPVQKARIIKWITIDDGETFEGTLAQFKDSYFDNADENSIAEFCERHEWKLEIKFSDGTSI